MAKNYDYLFPGCSFSLYDLNDKRRNAQHYIEYMLNRTQRMFEYTGLPDTIPARMLELYLQCNGSCAIAEYSGKLYAYTGGMGGEPDEYYRPTHYIINNPAQSFNKDCVIGKDCIIVRNDSMLLGLLPIHKKYAYLLSENDISFKIADINSRIISLISAPDDRTKRAADKYIEDVCAGKLASIAENSFLDGIKTQPYNASSSNSLKDLIEYHQYIRASWFQELGLNAAYNMKRESIGEAETSLNDDILLPLIDDMLACREESLSEVNSRFGTNISVKLSSAWEIVAEETENNSGRPEKKEGGSDESTEGN